MNKIFSAHTFLFPFKWEIKSKGDRYAISLDKRTSLYEVDQLLSKDFWKEFKFEIKVEDGYNTFNEYSYFYDYVRDVLHLDPEQYFINGKQYSYSGLSEDASYSIHILNEKTLKLSIKEASLNFLENGVGVFTFHLHNFETSSFDDILKINEYGRRIYPQFLGHTEPFTTGTKYSFLANKIILEGVSMIDNTMQAEDFSYYDNFTSIKKNPIKLPNHIGGLLGNNFNASYDQLQAGQALISPILDDRMFVMSMIYNDDLLTEFKKYEGKEKNDKKTGEEYNYISNSKWYRYLFVDDSTESCHSKTMLPTLLKKHSYDRWIDKVEKDGSLGGQLFGITRYSFVWLLGKSKFNENIMQTHFNTIYFQLMLHALIQRSYVINFSSEVARITFKLGKKNLSPRKSHEDISKLYLQYIKFVNRVYFREVTPQEQGIELYEKLLEHMRVKEDVSDLKEEIMELNNYVDTMQQKELNRIAATYLPVTLLASLLGMATIEKFNTITWAWGKDIDWQLTLLMISTIGIIGISLYLIIRRFLKRQ
jgi:hypothetical protein